MDRKGTLFQLAAAALFWIFSIEKETNSGICSTPTARPWGPTIKAKQQSGTPFLQIGPNVEIVNYTK